MSTIDSLDRDEIRHLKLFLYLVPMFGVFPAMWTLYRRAGSRKERALSRFVIKFALGWLVTYGLLGASATTLENGHLALLITASFLTSGYFLTNVWLMMRVWQRKSIGLPGIGKVGKLL
jgi:nitrate reductase gamma subunit